jgi:Kef-type K+ transport system membrane component KefB
VAGNSSKREQLVEYFHELSMYVFIPFFTQVGLQLNLPVLINSLGFSIVASLVRAFCMFLGTTAGGYQVKMPQDRALRLWMGLLPQAGVALGLAGIIGQQFSSTFGNSFQSTVLGVILVNQVIGPVFAKMLIKYCNEDGKSE